MSTFTVPTELASLLGQFQKVTELRDPQGNVIGIFTPRPKAEEERWERIKSLFDLEEAERILAAERHLGRPLQDIWRDLEGQGIAK